MTFDSTDLKSPPRGLCIACTAAALAAFTSLFMPWIYEMGRNGLRDQDSWSLGHAIGLSGWDATLSFGLVGAPVWLLWLLLSAAALLCWFKRLGFVELPLATLLAPNLVVATVCLFYGFMAVLQSQRVGAGLVLTLAAGSLVVARYWRLFSLGQSARGFDVLTATSGSSKD
ncbi:MAG: hypothetical protein AAF561_04770 [Planctomycetota bacterium]